MLLAPVADERILRGAAASIQVTWDDQHGEPVAAGGAVTVRVQKADGTDVVAAGSSTSGSNPYVRALTATQTATLEALTATWTDASNSATRTTRVDVADRFFFSRAYAEQVETALADDSKYSDTAFRRARLETEIECEKVCGVAFVPRYSRVVVDGSDDRELLLPHRALRRIRSVREYTSASAYTEYTAAELAAIAVKADGRILRPASALFTGGDANIVVEYEHGYDAPPRDLVHAAIQRCRYRLNMELNQDFADFTSVRGSDGTSYEIAGAIDDVEQRQVFRVYMRYAEGRFTAASRSFDFDPSRGSLFHGGRR